VKRAVVRQRRTDPTGRQFVNIVCPRCDGRHWLPAAATGTCRAGRPRPRSPSPPEPTERNTTVNDEYATREIRTWRIRADCDGVPQITVTLYNDTTTSVDGADWLYTDDARELADALTQAADEADRLENAISHPRCADCGVELLPDTPPGSRDWQHYMVHNQVWADAGRDDGWLCIPCLETRLRRPLTGADFLDLPINEPGRDDDTNQLAYLKRDAARRREEGGGD